MASPRSDPAALLLRVVGAVGLVCVAVLTLIDRGATRMYATPWNALFITAQFVPFAVLLLRTLSPTPPLALPAKRWCVLATVFAVGVLVSAWSSPHRGPSLLAALTPLAGLVAFVLIHDWLARDARPNSDRLLKGAALFSGALVALSLGRWVGEITRGGLRPDVSRLLQIRNAHPLGHSSYTAGLALLALPCLAAAAWRSRGITRAAWAIFMVLAIAMLVTSGSRGGEVGLCALVLAAIAQSRASWKTLVVSSLGALALVVAFTLANPRTRTLLFRQSTTAAALTTSTVQRTAMATAGWRMGVDRPVVGWGPGTTALVFPRYRSGLDGGVEDALQLHSTPVQLWGELGLIGAGGALAWFALVAGAALARRGHATIAPAAVALIGYGVFSLTDYQLDVPIVVLGIAAYTALIAAADSARALAERSGLPLTLGALAVLALIGWQGHADPTPRLNARALTLARDGPQTDAAIGLLRESLTLNPDQEIAHFNLGWLLVVRDPADAEKHFLAAAHLVPDKGGVYFGLALARLNQGRRGDSASIARALALECLNDPLFLTSPWWRQSPFAERRADTMDDLRSLCSRAAAALDARQDRRAREARWVSSLADWIDGKAAPGEMLAHAHTPERVGYFASRLPPPEFGKARILAYRRERTGYPILMRALDLPPPKDLFDVQENALASGELRFLFPPKGWLPAPLLLGLLDAPAFPRP